MKTVSLLILLFAFPGLLKAQQSFQVVPLGVEGGSTEGNLSAYLLALPNSNDYICLDAGTIHDGIEKAIEFQTFDVSASVVLHRYIKGYFISHGHLDHLAGMILNSPDDSVKNIYAMPYVVNILKDKYFSWKSWANFADDGEAPALKKYHYTVLDTIQELPIAQTTMRVKTFILSHAIPYQSTAFLIRHEDDYVLYLGDTGADTLEHSNRLRQLWQAIAPLVKQKKLKGIFIENSFPDGQPDKQLFGHLTPRLLMNEMKVLQDYCGAASALEGLTVIITHRKPIGNNEQAIKLELKTNNPYKLNIIFPEQGRRMVL